MTGKLIGFGLVVVSSLLLTVACQKAEAPAAPSPVAAVGQTAAIIAQYRVFAADQIDNLVIETTKFSQAIIDGQIAKARELYPTARMFYERIEPVAEAIGELDARIDAREDGVPANEWVGFHKLEKFLWSASGAEPTVTAEVKTLATNLVNDTKLLRAKLESAPIDFQLLLGGAVELLNEVSATKVTGEEERYSRTDVYDMVANLEGSKKIFELVSPALKVKDAALNTAVAEAFGKVETLLQAFKRGAGYELTTKISKEQLKEVSRAIDALAEPLSKIPKAFPEVK